MGILKSLAQCIMQTELHEMTLVLSNTLPPRRSEAKSATRRRAQSGGKPGAPNPFPDSKPPGFFLPAK